MVCYSTMAVMVTPMLNDRVAREAKVLLVQVTKECLLLSFKVYRSKLGC